MPHELSELVPRHKLDLERAQAAVAAGYPAVAPVLPALLEWVQDMNWPVARVLAPLLASIGVPMEAHIREVLGGPDCIWKYWVLQEVVAQSADLRRALRPELVRLASAATNSEKEEELDALAQSLLEA